jgi:hypothetical protein
MVCIWISDLFCLSALSVLTAMASKVKHPLISRTDTDHKQRRLPKSLQKEQAHLCRVSVIWALTHLPLATLDEFWWEMEAFRFLHIRFSLFFHLVLKRQSGPGETTWPPPGRTTSLPQTERLMAGQKFLRFLSWASLPPAFCDKSHESSHGFKWKQQAVYSWKRSLQSFDAYARYLLVKLSQ